MGPNEPISQEVGSKRNKAEPQDLPSPFLPKEMQQRNPGKPLVCKGRTLNLILPLPLTIYRESEILYCASEPCRRRACSASLDLLQAVEGSLLKLK